MKKKRIVCLALCACLLMGCGGAPAVTPEAAVSPAPAATPGMDASPASPAGLAGQYAGRVFVTAQEFAALLGEEGVVAVDMQSAANYAQGHAPGAVNLQKNDIVVNAPVADMLTSSGQLEAALGERGIGNDTLVLVYDSNGFFAGRLFWSLTVFGCAQNVKIVEGGLPAIVEAGVEMTTEVPAPEAREFKTGEKQGRYLARRDDVLEMCNEPDGNHILLDVRTDEQVKDGVIPGSVHVNFDGDFSEVLSPENQVTIYSLTSLEAGMMFARLYDAGYENIRVYDGGWLEWYPNIFNPVDNPSDKVLANRKDLS